MIRQCTGTEHFLFIRLIITCWSSAGFTIHVPSSWPHHHHSNRVSMASIIKWACFPRGLKDSKTNSLVSDDGYLQVSRKKKLHMQLAYEGDQFKKGKNVSLLCCCHILVCHTKIKQMIHGSIEQWGNINGTDRQTDIQQTPCHSNQSRQIEIHVYQNMLFFPPKRVLECTSVQENCSYIKTFLNHAPSWLAVK